MSCIEQSTKFWTKFISKFSVKIYQLFQNHEVVTACKKLTGVDATPSVQHHGQVVLFCLFLFWNKTLVLSIWLLVSNFYRGFINKIQAFRWKWSPQFKTLKAPCFLLGFSFLPAMRLEHQHVPIRTFSAELMLLGILCLHTSKMVRR